MTSESKPARPAGARLPNRLHHSAYLVRDQERTRHFYEDIIGLPLRAAWIESEPYEGTNLEFCHTFFGIGDGGALAFFNIANAEVAEKFLSQSPQNLFHHLALEADEETQAAIRERCKAAGLPFQELEHGYCKSLYVHDPDGMLVEFTVDPPNLAEVIAYQERVARDSLKAWQAGDRRPNNKIRHG